MTKLLALALYVAVLAAGTDAAGASLRSTIKGTAAGAPTVVFGVHGCRGGELLVSTSSDGKTLEACAIYAATLKAGMFSYNPPDQHCIPFTAEQCRTKGRENFGAHSTYTLYDRSAAVVVSPAAEKAAAAAAAVEKAAHEAKAKAEEETHKKNESQKKAIHEAKVKADEAKVKADEEKYQLEKAAQEKADDEKYKQEKAKAKAALAAAKAEAATAKAEAAKATAALAAAKVELASTKAALAAPAPSVPVPANAAATAELASIRALLAKNEEVACGNAGGTWTSDGGTSFCQQSQQLAARRSMLIAYVKDNSLLDGGGGAPPAPHGPWGRDKSEQHITGLLTKACEPMYVADWSNKFSHGLKSQGCPKDLDNEMTCTAPETSSWFGENLWKKGLNANYKAVAASMPPAQWAILKADLMKQCSLSARLHNFVRGLRKGGQAKPKTVMQLVKSFCNYRL